MAATVALIDSINWKKYLPPDPESFRNDTSAQELQNALKNEVHTTFLTGYGHFLKIIPFCVEKGSKKQHQNPCY